MSEHKFRNTKLESIVNDAKGVSERVRHEHYMGKAGELAMENYIDILAHCIIKLAEEIDKQ